MLGPVHLQELGADLSEAERHRLIAAAEGHGKAVLVEPVFDTVKLMEDGWVATTLDRETLAWPVAWAWLPELRPGSDPPPPEWFTGVFVMNR